MEINENAPYACYRDVTKYVIATLLEPPGPSPAWNKLSAGTKIGIPTLGPVFDSQEGTWDGNDAPVCGIHPWTKYEHGAATAATTTAVNCSTTDTTGAGTGISSTRKHSEFANCTTKHGVLGPS